MRTVTEEQVFKSFLKKRGLKYTRERRAMLRGIGSCKGHFDADELHASLQKRQAKLSRATVYRSLSLFIESGLIQETARQQGRTFYEHVFGGRHHDHLLCLACGQIIEFQDERIEKLQNHVCDENRFEAKWHQLVIRGYCDACRENQ